MNTKLVRSEHLLWMTPILYGIVVYITSYTDIVMSFYNGAYILVTFPQLITAFLVFLIIPFILHWELRDRNLRDLVISWAHILLSVGMVVAILFIYSFTLPINVKWIHYTGELPAVQKWAYYNSIAIIIMKGFISLQIIYSIYATTKLVLSIRAQKRDDLLIDEDLYFDKHEEMGTQMIA
ncbi:MAG: hypothetical protein RL596_865 [Bacteroidota bacterium]|jgi:hypothetical protein